jgi:hypothetical protein
MVEYGKKKNSQFSEFVKLKIYVISEIIFIIYLL